MCQRLQPIHYACSGIALQFLAAWLLMPPEVERGTPFWRRYAATVSMHCRGAPDRVRSLVPPSGSPGRWQNLGTSRHAASSPTPSRNLSTLHAARKPPWRTAYVIRVRSR
jgi:hypothetical protein